MKPALAGLAVILLLSNTAARGRTQEPSRDASRARITKMKNVLYANPVHLMSSNITLTYERFTGPHSSVDVMLSGGARANYVAAAVGLRLYPARAAAINYFLGGSLMAYESPMVTGVPIAGPWNTFFESSDDRYYAALEIQNGVLFRPREFLNVALDGSIGPAVNVTQGGWLTAWAIELNLGIPF